ncbi:hypothetical protein H0H92_015517, partial [Tricholoma furcatifolium]
MSSGRNSWAKGSKLEFLESYKQEFLDSQDDERGSGEFYHKIARLFFQRWGWTLKYDVDGPITPDVEDRAAAGILNFGPEVSEEESKERRVLYKRVRDRIGQWYRYRYRNTRAEPAKKNNTVNEILQALRQITTDAPRKQTALQLYTSLNYKTKIKADVDKEWAKLQADAKKNGTTVGIPRIALTNEFLARRFAEEPEDVREALEQQTKAEFMKAKTAFKMKADWKPRSAAEYKVAMDEAATTLVPFADAIAERYGMYACILLCGPTDKGEISLKSVHSNVEDTQLGKIWPVEDREGYAAAQQSIINYTKKIYTQQECNARKIVPGEPLEGLGAVLSAIEDDDDDILAAAGVTRDPTISAAVYDNVVEYIARKSEEKAGPSKKHENKQNREQEDIEAHHVEGNPAPQGPPSAVDPAPAAAIDPAPAFAVEIAPAPVVETASALDAASALAIDVAPAVDTASGPAGAPDAEPGPSPVVETTLAVVQDAPADESRACSSDPIALSEELDNLMKSVPKGNKMLEGLTRLCDKKWGAEWEACLCSLIEFEKSRSFPSDGGKLPTAGRPPIVGQWFRNHRKEEDQVIDGDFPGAWWTWWRGIKDMEAEIEGDDAVGDVEVDWKALDQAGINGLYLVVVCLSWWGEKVKDVGREYPGPGGWLAGLKEVTWVLRELCNRDNEAVSSQVNK